MDLQNVSSLVIPEGSVRTIHDKNSRLLWGKLSYDTKYAGDIAQQSYTGKNKINFTTIAFSGVNSGTGTRDGNTFTITGTSASSGLSFTQSNLHLLPNTTYTFSAKVVSTGSSNGARIYIASAFNVDAASISGNYAFDGEISQATFTTPDSISTTATIRIYTGQANVTTVYTDLQVEISSTATAYEPYVGGAPAPNPDYPQSVNVVTGEQTITVTDGDVSQTYTVDLGTIELCKIGTYQDYIYKSGNDWYVHKEIGKYTFKGDEDISYNSGNHGFIISAANLPNYFVGIADAPLRGFSTHFTVNSTTVTWVRDNTIGLSSTNTFWCRALSFANSLQDCQTWLTNNTPSVYYTLGTATETQITGTTLISQLNAIHDWLTRYGYTATVAGNLPIIINQTTLN